jgi:putative SOS response-associated peptidase YedK
MCNRYVAPDPAAIERAWRVDARTLSRPWARHLYPQADGPFIRATEGARELVVGPWGLIPHFAQTAKLP